MLIVGCLSTEEGESVGGLIHVMFWCFRWFWHHFAYNAKRRAILMKKRYMSWKENRKEFIHWWGFRQRFIPSSPRGFPRVVAGQNNTKRQKNQKIIHKQKSITILNTVYNQLYADLLLCHGRSSRGCLDQKMKRCKVWMSWVRIFCADGRRVIFDVWYTPTQTHDSQPWRRTSRTVADWSESRPCF